MTEQQTRGLTTADLASAADREVSDVDTGGRGTAARAEAAPPLFAEGDVDRFRGRWQQVQTGFVDDPRRAVHDADELVASVISSLAQNFAEHKGELEGQWREGEPATEDLRIALRRYRAFFDRLLDA
ncbi:hypothetical protein ACWEOE_17595 [Amycolatopsis sp. NPDC004368]